MQTYYDKVAIFQQFVHLQEYREKLQLTPYLQTLFELSQQTIKAEYDKSLKKPNTKLKKYKDNLEERFIEAYEKLTSLEKLDMYIRQMKYVKDVIEQNAQEQNNVPESIEEHQAYTLSYSLHIWRKKHLRLKHYKGILEITRDERTKEYDLRNYVIRESKNSEYNCFVLESINNKVTQKNKVVRVGFKSIPLFQEWFLAVKATIIRVNKEKIKEELEKCPQFNMLEKVVQKEVGSEKQEDLPHFGSRKKPSFQQQANTPNAKNNNSDSEGSDMTVKTIVQTLLDNSSISHTMQQFQTASQAKRHMNIFSLILPQYRLDSLSQTYFHQIIYEQKDMKIYRNNDIEQRYKVFIPTRQTDIQNVVKVLFNVESYPQWNSSIEQSSIKSIISSQNMIIIYEKHKQYNTIYRPRDFVYLRHVFNKDNNMYIVDKSITNSTYPPYMIIVRGTIGCIWGIIKNEEGEFTVIADVMIQNQGLINSGQDHNLSMMYLKGLLNLQSRIQKTRDRKASFNVFDLDWNIDNVILSEQKIKLRSDVTKSVPTTPFKQPKESLEEKIVPKTGYEKKRRETIQQQQQKLVIEERKRRGTVQEKTEKQITQNASKLEKSVVLDNKKMEDSTIVVKIPITSINYEFDSIGEVIIPQGFVSTKYLLVPSPPKEPLLQQIVNGHAIWKGEWKFDKNGGIIFINQTKIDYQKGVFKYVLGKIAKNLISGKSILHISLPVDIFAPETNLERFAFSMTYAPLILEKAFKQKAAIQKFKHVIAYGLTNSVLYLNMEKPFNPILGETFQGWINGCPIYLEQISHHPPIASFLFLGRGYKITGSLESKVEMQMNSGCGITDGVYRIMTDDGADFNFITPGGEISGLTFGDRKFNLVGKYYVWSKRHQLFVEIKLDPTNKGFFSRRDQPSDYMQGNIFQVTRQFIEDFQLMKKKDKPSKDHIIHDLGKASGIWSKVLLVDGQTYLDLDKDIGCKLEYDGHLLPSDGNWREDVAYKRLNDNPRSQSEKQRLENIQRNDRKLREKHGGAKH